MALLSYSQLEGLWIGAGGSRVFAPLMAAIAIAESGEQVGGVWYSNSDALNPDDNGGTQTSVGSWQVSSGTHDYPAAWLTPQGNAAEAVSKFQTQGLTAWGTYNSGAYKKFLEGKVPPSVTGHVGPQDNQGGGIISQITSGIWGFLQLPLGALSGASDLASSILALAAPFVKIAEAIDWLLHPSHWIRIFAGLAGGVLVLGGAWQLTHAGSA